jgi:hypothetical protein
VKESTSSSDFLKRTAFAALWTGIVLGLAVAWKWGWHTGAGFVLALAWGLGNFAVLAAILTVATQPSGVRVGHLVGLVAVKLIGLYGIAAWVLLSGWVSLPAFVAGFSWTLAVTVLRALGSLTVKAKLNHQPKGKERVP